MTKHCCLNVFRMCSFHAFIRVYAPDRLLSYLLSTQPFFVSSANKDLTPLSFPCRDRNIQISPDVPAGQLAWKSDYQLSMLFFSSIHLNNMHHCHIEKGCVIIIHIPFPRYHNAYNIFKCIFNFTTSGHGCSRGPIDNKHGTFRTTVCQQTGNNP